MNYRNLGRTGLNVSPLCIGAWLFGDRTPEQEAIKIVEYALDRGINFFDTSDIYSKGLSEEILGNAIKASGKRERVIVSTKFVGKMVSGDPNSGGASRRHIISACEASLKRLNTEYIDIYFIHQPQPGTAIDETLRAMDDLVRAGKVRYLGSSNFTAWRVMESLWASKELGLNRLVCEQPPYNILDRRIERELVPMAQSYGLGVTPWSPIAGGILTGKYSSQGQPSAGTRLAGTTSSSSKLLKKSSMDTKAFDVAAQLKPLAESKGCTLSQFSLAWCMNQPAITSPIAGPRTLEQLKDNLSAIDIDVTDEDRARVDAIVPPGRMISPFYEPNFSPNRHQW